MPVGAGASGGGDVGPAGELEGGTDQVAQDSQDGGGVVAANLAGVLAEGDIAAPVHGVFHGPVAAGTGGDLGRSGLLSGQVGDRVDGLGAPAFLPGRTPLALGAQDLGGVGEQQVVDGDDLDEPAFASAVASGVLAVDDGESFQGRVCSWRASFFWFPLIVNR